MIPSHDAVREEVSSWHGVVRSVARLDATKTSLIKALSSNETATNWGVSTSSPEVIVYRRKVLQALQQGDQVRVYAKVMMRVLLSSWSMLSAHQLCVESIC